MADLSLHLPCPVCLGTRMEKVAVGPNSVLELDHCRRCGGVWLEHGEVQRLRALPGGEIRKQLGPRHVAFRTRCHDCHAQLQRADEKCPACGWMNHLDCPECATPMRVESHAGLRLDVCRTCKGAWFDHHELQAIWTAHFDQALRKRHLPAGTALRTAGDGAGDVLFDVLFYAPNLAFHGARAAGHAVSASVEVAARVPGALASTPEAASAAFEAVGEAAGGVFEVIVGILGGIFDGL